jgi:hypothetical protein
LRQSSGPEERATASDFAPRREFSPLPAARPRESDGRVFDDTPVRSALVQQNQTDELRLPRTSPRAHDRSEPRLSPRGSDPARL